MTDNIPKRALTFEQWSIINRALCGARLELAGVTFNRGAVSTKQERYKALGEALDELNEYEEIA